MGSSITVTDRAALRRAGAAAVCLGLLGGVLTGAGCASHPAAPPHRVPSAPPRAALLPPVWSGFSEVLGWPTLTTRAFRSQGHAPHGTRQEVRANPAASAAYGTLAPNTELPSGARLAALLYTEPQRPLQRVLVMEKSDTGWSYRVLSGDGRPQTVGALTTCERCHAEAPADHLYGLPWPERAPLTEPRKRESPGANASGPRQEESIVEKGNTDKQQTSVAPETPE